MHVHAGLRERRAKLGIPVLAVIDVGKAVAAVLNGVVRAKKSRFDMLGFRNIASPDEHMANGDVPQHLREQIIQIITRDAGEHQDRKSTRLNSSHTVISYAVFCLKKKTKP